ncbi:54S ribosomal protein L51, mitochondrial [[Candida] railenensis]|uniref:Large ribosomal subunit protein mL43 n=1 Tax=[Candida] railenensis TaxID=45579 RepID=A0A9P0QUW6_9ASCO|nr:54S ribosomal protein L51, mitochondrial [[Candida] railenensis]
MPVKAIPKVSVARNGLGSYIVPCHKIRVNYCNWGGSSKGVREILKSGELNQLGLTKKSIFFEVVKRQGHPSVEFYYNNDSVKDIPVKNMEASDVLKKINQFSQASGAELFKWNHKVLSTNESVRGIWSPMHVAKNDRHKI